MKYTETWLKDDGSVDWIGCFDYEGALSLAILYMAIDIVYPI